MEATGQPSAPHEKVRIVFQICSLDFKSYPLRQESSLGEKNPDSQKKIRLVLFSVFQGLSSILGKEEKKKVKCGDS